MRRARPAGQRGVSLIEAIVAMAVMAFGMMAVVGLQTTLRQNSDIAKQRSEAVRIAEEAIEQWRAFSIMGATSGSSVGYGDIQTPGTDTTIVPDALNMFNTTFTLKRTVSAFPGVVPGSFPATAAGLKSLRVEVSWVDRNGQPQSVTLDSIIAAADPALSGILTMAPPGGGLPSNPPLGRNPVIPVGAEDRDGGNKSIFIPGSGVLWVFDNLTGVIVGVCNTVVTGQSQVTDADTQACVASTTGFGLPLSGYVRFATGMVQPTAADAEFPTSRALNLDVVLTLSSTGHASPDHVCYTNAPTSTPTSRRSVRYHCAIFFNANAVPVWSGISDWCRWPSPPPRPRGLGSGRRCPRCARRQGFALPHLPLHAGDQRRAAHPEPVAPAHLHQRDAERAAHQPELPGHPRRQRPRRRQRRQRLQLPPRRAGRPGQRRLRQQQHAAAPAAAVNALKAAR